jgi:hypothetical protein
MQVAIWLRWEPGADPAVLSRVQIVTDDLADEIVLFSGCVRVRAVHDRVRMAKTAILPCSELARPLGKPVSRAFGAHFEQ